MQQNKRIGPWGFERKKEGIVVFMIEAGQKLDNFELIDHAGQCIRLSDLTEGDEFERRLGFGEGRLLLLVFYRGFFCPRDRRQLSQLVEFYPETQLNHVCLVVISADTPIVAAAYRAGLGADFPFLSDADRQVITQLGIVDNTDGEYPNIAIPHTLWLTPDLTVAKVYTGWWFAGRPSVEELRQDLRALMQERADYAHAAWGTPAVKSVRIPAAYWAGDAHVAELKIVGHETGRVLWFAKGQGMIRVATGEELFFHFTGIPGQGNRSLAAGENVVFDIVDGPHGRHAVNIQPSRAG